MTKHGTSWTQAATPVNGPAQQTDWNRVNWRNANTNVRRLRQRIFRASQVGDFRKVRSLQKLMLRSYSNRLTSVRRVTQQNQGRRTAGVDKVVVKTPAARGRFVDALSRYRPWQARPAKRVYIPKANRKQRPLGIPVMRDRALQAMVKNALEPEWESRFEGTSYGFRPGRSTQDAAQQIFLIASGRSNRRWVLDADIKGAFDNINHDHLLQTIGLAPGRELIRQWLKAGYMDLGTLHPTDAGTPQGGVISPLLANITLHGMEQALGITARNRTCPRLVHYADDFVVLCHTQEDAEQARECLTGWLAKRGLTLSEEKTRIVHLTEGFDFLGWNFRHYKVTDTRSGYKLLIKPSKNSVQAVKAKLKAIWMEHRGKPVDILIRQLNPVIRGWANYHRTVVSSKTFRSLDHWMYKRQASHVRFAHPMKPTYWKLRRYWGNQNPDRPRDRWVFGQQGQHPYLHKFAWTNIQRHVLVTGANSPDDPGLRDYWEQRRLAQAKRTANQKWRMLLLRQNGLCPYCGESTVPDLAEGPVTMVEETQQHHQRPRNQGGTNAWNNLMVLHLYCHQQAHSDMRRQTKLKEAADE
jgi:RNA-directed DNA polymerase